MTPAAGEGRDGGGCKAPWRGGGGCLVTNRKKTRGSRVWGMAGSDKKGRVGPLPAQPPLGSGNNLTWGHTWRLGEPRGLLLIILEGKGCQEHLRNFSWTSDKYFSFVIFTSSCYKYLTGTNHFFCQTDIFFLHWKFVWRLDHMGAWVFEGGIFIQEKEF